jgi:hypothetical protein
MCWALLHAYFFLAPHVVCTCIIVGPYTIDPRALQALLQLGHGHHSRPYSYQSLVGYGYSPYI